MKHRGALAAGVVLLMLGVPLGAYVGAYYYRTVVVADLTVGNTGEPVEMRVFPTKWESALFTPLSQLRSVFGRRVIHRDLQPTDEDDL